MRRALSPWAGISPNPGSQEGNFSSWLSSRVSPFRKLAYFSGLHPGGTDHGCLAVPTVHVAWDTATGGVCLSALRAQHEA